MLTDRSKTGILEKIGEVRKVRTGQYVVWVAVPMWKNKYIETWFPTIRIT